MDSPHPAMPDSDASRPDQAEVLYSLRNIKAELRNTQALVARIYERFDEWPKVVERMRAHPSYERAYQPDPLVSVRVATYNQARLLCERALPSLIHQTYRRWEAIVVGDACTDDTERMVRRLGDERISFVNLPFRGPYPDDDKARWYVGGIPPMNEALARAQGSWIAPLDHDDEWDADHLEVLLLNAQAHQAEVSYGGLRIVDAESGESLPPMGQFPPIRGTFGFLGAIHHAGLKEFRYDMNCRFADEPGDWNVARRMWEAGVRFRYLDRPVATAFHTPRHQVLTTEAAMIEELRGWSSQLLEQRDIWRAEAQRQAAEAERWRTLSEARLAVPPSAARALRRARASLRRAGGPE